MGMSGFVRSVDTMTNSTITQQFFDSYTRALLDRDAKAIAEHYAVPALIEFPDHPIAVSDASQTEQFFSGAFGQYEAVSTRPGTASCSMSPGPTTPARRVSASSTSSSAAVATGGSPS